MEQNSNNFDAILQSIKQLSTKKPKASTPFDIKQAHTLVTAIGQSIDKRFKIDDDNSVVYKNLCRYFNNYQSDIDTSKGILLQGKTGTGKTTVINVFNHFNKIYKNQFPNIKNYPIEEIEQSLKAYGSEWLLNTMRKSTICINDVGDENDELVLFGERCNLIKILVPFRYELFQTTGIKTFYTTNLTKKQILERYGERIAKRIYDMCTVVTLNGKNRRDND